MSYRTIDEVVQNKSNPEDVQKRVHFEEALDLTGYGKYNYGLLAVCSLTLLAMGMDLYAMSFVVPAAACDLNLTVSQRGILSAISFMGVIVSLIMWGYLSDTRGRRFILIWSMWAGFVFSFLSGFSPNWIVMAVLKFFASAFTAAANSAVFTLLGESSPAHARSRALLLMSTCLFFAQGIIALIAWPLLPLPFAPPIDFLGITYRPWRLMIQLIASVCGMSALSLQFFHESPKFLATQGRSDEAIAVLQKIYATNTGDMSENYPVRKLYFNKEHISKNSSVLRSMWKLTVQLFKKPLLYSTLKIYHIFIVVYGTIPAFIIWYPTILNSYINAEASGTASGNNLCGTLFIGGSLPTGNSTINEEVCNDQLQDVTVYAVLIVGIASALLSFLIAMLVSCTGKSVIIISTLVVGSICGIICNLVYNPLIGLVLLTIFQMEGVCLGLISAFCIDLYPTEIRFNFSNILDFYNKAMPSGGASNRRPWVALDRKLLWLSKGDLKMTASQGVAVCLAIMIGRISGFVSINVVGLLLEMNCESVFYIFGFLSLSGIISAFLLPSESAVQKSTKDNDS